MKSKSKKPKKKQFSSLKARLKADREKEIEQVSLRPSSVHKSKKDYDRKKNKVKEGDLE